LQAGAQQDCQEKPACQNSFVHFIFLVRTRMRDCRYSFIR
jgi:hypothetical protein